MAFLSAQSPPGMIELQSWVLDTPAQLRVLRAGLHEAITGQPLPAGAQLDEIPEKMVLVATELATNALRHGLPPTIVRLGRTKSIFVLDVADHSPDVIPQYTDDRPPGAGGLGLQLAKKFALEIGWYIEDDTKHVWAEFPVAD
ncbi:ATP-binding protein [Actinoplanes friuliensis]|jgi:serine/threonine-protein kinase RsbW|uniref:Anti-sigma regulatory factor, serine/threonine protein kinase n=1 Tax=Actinoplanes friuliensis DSM 7358 TaxID=1246995 RepID=U5VRT9_9ACTN|nr:ATP-binding protein [Actinoplanes friuliensis]AGZ38455.1 anti-sigma regulatory factor, serine/threonine protein kinase [Actinoplanes friuliensis DSM 7358]